MTTGVITERERIAKLRTQPPDTPLVLQESARQDSARTKAELPARERLPSHVKRSLKSYERLWSATIDPPSLPPPPPCPSCGRSDGGPPPIINGEKRGVYCVRCGRSLT